MTLGTPDWDRIAAEADAKFDRDRDRALELEALHYTAWINSAGKPVIEDYDGHETIRDAIVAADEWQQDLVEHGEREQIVVVRGLKTREVVWMGAGQGLRGVA